MLCIDVVAMPLAITRVASIMAQRQFDVVTMDVAAPVDGLRRITVEVDTADEIRLGRLVKFLNRSPDVVEVVHLSAEIVDTTRAAPCSPQPSPPGSALSSKPSAASLFGTS
ncbi:hypothetical protein [Streptomyces sp. NPDC004685]